MTAKIPKTTAEYEAALHEARRLAALDPAPGTREADDLEVLALLVSDYEAKNFPLRYPDPVEAIRFRMEQMGLAQQDLVPYIGSKSKVSEILSGKRRLTLSMIRALTSGLGIPVRALVQDSRRADVLPDEFDWRQFPVREMAARGYFGALGSGTVSRDSAEALVREFLAPLGTRATPLLTKQSQHIRSDRALERYGLTAWAAQVMRRALRNKPSGEYKAGSVDDAFMRHVAQLSWSSQAPTLAREFLTQHGISLIIERHLTGTYLDGAALLLAPDHPVIGMTLRYDRLDNFWFCLMHELAHIRFHLKRNGEAFFDDLADLDIKKVDATEKEADEVAREALVPGVVWKRSAASTVRSSDAAVSLARQLHVDPAVVAGRIRYESKDFRVLSSLIGRVRQLFPEYQSGAGV